MCAIEFPRVEVLAEANRRGFQKSAAFAEWRFAVRLEIFEVRRGITAPMAALAFDERVGAVQFDEAPPTLRRAPEHGEHTEEVLLEMGISWEEIAAYKESAAIL